MVTNAVLAICGTALASVSTAVVLRRYADRRVPYVKDPDDAPRKWLRLRLLGGVLLATGAMVTSYWLVPMVVLVWLIAVQGQMWVHNQRVQRSASSADR